MIKMILENFSLEKISLSGQCFRFKKLSENKYCVIAFGEYLEMEQYGNEVIFHCSEKQYHQIWYNYFDLDNDYSQYKQFVPSTDSYLTKAMSFGKGIVILNQDIWETILSFIISQQNNIKRIQYIIELLCQKYGDKKTAQNGTIYYTFPTVQSLQFVTEKELQNCNLGYRSKYIVKIVNDILQKKFDIDYLKSCNYVQCKIELMKLYGVGEKVADCVCLFGLHHLNAFPIDTHIKKVLQKHYAQGFPFALYAGYEGVMQQYLFYYDLYNKD